MVKLSNVTMTGQGEYVSVVEAAFRVKVHPETLHRWIRAGKLPAYCQGHATRVRLSDVLSPKVVVRRPRSAAPKSGKRLATFIEAAPPPPEIPPAAAPEDAQATPSTTGSE